ncbi:hypothetical protein HK097_009920 [Rhizophlyctis rosea]|uniref:Uncharacterized protein n=1 Tax=Rhizophlyctis rosea TaxID=64517 RepID=A0AAD5SRU8_9FUNG|nr:hypothetical protein HK097_009920 [Rhizophlyctis rosea]
MKFASFLSSLAIFAVGSLSIPAPAPAPAPAPLTGTILPQLGQDLNILKAFVQLALPAGLDLVKVLTDHCVLVAASGNNLNLDLTGSIQEISTQIYFIKRGASYCNAIKPDTVTGNRVPNVGTITVLGSSESALWKEEGCEATKSNTIVGSEVGEGGTLTISAGTGAKSFGVKCFK